MKKLELKDHLHWFIPTAVSSLIIIFWSKTIWGLFLLISCAYFIFHFWEHLKNYWDLSLKYIGSKLKIKDTKKILYWIIIFFILILLWLLVFIVLWNSKPKIYDLTQGYNLNYKEEFNIDSVWSNWVWFYEDWENEFITNDIWAKTLNTNAKKQRTYALFQDLRDVSGQQILMWKFKLREWWKVWIRFVNTLWANSDQIRENHSNECVLQYYKTDSISMWYGHQVTKSNFLWNESTFQDKDLSEWTYYVLAKIWWDTFSCYYQKESSDQIYEIIKDKKIIFQNLWWPLLAKYIDAKNSYRELLEFRLYTK